MLLQSLLTSHVLPKREQLLQLARRIKVVEVRQAGSRRAGWTVL